MSGFLMRGWLFFALLTMTLFAASLLPEQSAQEGIWSLAFGSFLSGVLLTFTPCVLPMMPILSSIIAGEGEKLSRMRAVSLSLAYVLGTTVTYAAMGALAGATGEQLQSYFENVWVITAVSLIFVLMALSMFGLYNLELPPAIQTRLNAASTGLKGGRYGTVFLLGMISALILGACVSPILIAFLGVAIAKADPLLGALTMFFMALGMGVPLLLLGLGLGTLLPKAGAWMDRVKYTFGVLLLATAIYLFSITELVSPLFLWGPFLIVLSIYLGALDPTVGESGWQKLQKGVGVVLLVWGLILLLGAAHGERDPLRPFAGEDATRSTLPTLQRETIPFEEVDSMEAFEKKRQEAVEKGKLLIAFFSHDFCGSCKKYKATTFRDPRVIDALKRNYVAVHINMTDKSDKGRQEIRKHFKVFGPPTFIFFDRKGKEIEDNRIYGYQSPDEFLDMLELMSE